MSTTFLQFLSLDKLKLFGIVLCNILLIGQILRSNYRKRKSFIKNIKRQG